MRLTSRRLLSEIGDGWDMLAHVAGVPGTAPAADVLKVNYLGMRLMVEGMLPLLRQGGSIVTVASTAALGWQQRLDILDGLLELTDGDAVAQWQTGQDPDFPVYTTSKQAAILFTKRLAGPAWSKYGVRVNTVEPGPGRDAHPDRFRADHGQGGSRLGSGDRGRHATVEDVVPLIAFLASPEARWINGQDIQVDGGFIAVDEQWGPDRPLIGPTRRSHFITVRFTVICISIDESRANGGVSCGK